LLLNTLKHICYDDLPPYLVTAKFCEDVLNGLGYEISYQNCSSCNSPYLNKVFLNLDNGEFVCNNCKSQNSLQISMQALSLLKILSMTEYERLNSIKISSSVAKEAIHIICKDLEFRLLKIIHSSKFI